MDLDFTGPLYDLHADNVPPCFTCKQWQDWREAMRGAGGNHSKARLMRAVPPANSYCTDCTPEYQSRMVLARRCRFPGTLFITDEDTGMPSGVRPSHYQLGLPKGTNK